MQRLSLFIFIDALGWEVLRDRNFLEEELTHRRKLRSVFGYSSACVPSILAGAQPEEHGHWSFYFKNTESSPFRWFKWMRYLPLQNRGRVRHLLSKFAKKLLGWSGYFQFYNMPFKFIDRFDYCEKQDIFAPGGMNKGTHIFDYLTVNNIPYHVSDWRASEEANMASLEADIKNEQPRFAFLYMAAMDALLHEVGKHSPEVDIKLAWYEEKLRHLFSVAREHYGDVDIFICSDHGMATVTEHLNLMKDIESLPLVFGKDYLAVYDSTMARFWFANNEARDQIEAALAQQSLGRVLSHAELTELGCDFNAQYGEMVFLLDPGAIICPSHMGEKPVTGMHGYHPDDADSDAVLLSSRGPATDPLSITDLNALMRYEVNRA